MFQCQLYIYLLLQLLKIIYKMSQVVQLIPFNVNLKTPNLVSSSSSMAHIFCNVNKSIISNIKN